MQRILLLSVALLTIGITGCSKKQKEDTPVIPKDNEVLIEVDGHKLTYGEAKKLMDKRLGGPPPKNFTPDRIKRVRDITLSQVVDQFVKRTLLLEEADKMEITASDKEIQAGLVAFLAKVKQDSKSPKAITDAEKHQLRNEVAVGIRIEKLLAIKFPPKKPTDKELDAFIKANQQRLVDPDKKPFPRDKVAAIMRETLRRKQLHAYLRELQQKAEIKHAANVIPPKYE